MDSATPAPEGAATQMPLTKLQGHVRPTYKEKDLRSSCPIGHGYAFRGWATRSTRLDRC
jgi:hypothetical protein